LQKLEQTISLRRSLFKKTKNGVILCLRTIFIVGKLFMEKAVLAGGCFWCTEAIFKRLKGVYEVLPGFSGGHTKNPTYEDVVTGTTGHAESIQIEFNPKEISYDKILEIFFHLHDPTTLNRQGNDVGTQYRSAIFYIDEKQKETAIKVRDEIAESGVYKDSIVTEIVPFEKFYFAENYHRDYYENNRNQGYCSFVISPKVHKLLEEYSKDIKDEYKKE
jgi:peptide-methionine (S)-S-oxide reductase